MQSTGHSGVVETLLMLEQEHKTGALDFRAEGVLTRIFVDDGIPVFAEAGVVGETLGNVLLREQLITSTELAVVVRKMTDVILDGDKDNVRFSEVVVDLGILTQQQLTNALATQIEKKIIGCIARGVGEWSFDESRDVKNVVRHAAPIRTLLVDGARLLPELAAADTFPVTIQTTAQIADDYGLEDAEIVALGQLDGTHATESIVESSLLHALVMGGAVELLTERGAKSPPTVTAPIVMTGRRRASRAKLVVDDNLKIAIEEPATRVPSLRPARNDREATIFAEDEFQSGKRLFSQGKMSEAHEQLVLARDRSPHVPLYSLYEQFVRSRVQERFEDLSTTKALAVKMLKEDAECAFAYYVLGYIALEDGGKDSAKRFFTQAFRLDPELLDAGRQARKLDSSAPREIAPTRATTAPAAKRPSSPGRSAMSRTTVLFLTLIALTVGTVGYVASVRAGVWSAYQEVR